MSATSRSEQAAPMTGVDERAAPPPFTPDRWISDATRQVDVASAIDPLLAALLDPENWPPLDDDPQQRGDRLRRLAAAIREAAPLYDLAAALIVPYLRAALPSADDSVPLADDDAIRANLVAVMAHLFDTEDRRGYDPWLGLAEWLWSHQLAWASAQLQRRLGHEQARALPVGAYRRAIAETLAGTGQEELRLQATQSLVSYAQEVARIVVSALDLANAAPRRRDYLLARRPAPEPAALLPAVYRGGQVDLAPLLSEGYLRVFNAAHYHALRAALATKSFTQVAGSPWPTAQLADGAIQAQAELRPLAVDVRSSMPADDIDRWVRRMWEQRNALSDLDADALDALSALWLYQARSARDRAAASVDELLELRGITPRARGNGRRSGYQPEQRREMLQAINHIQSLWINLVLEEGDGGAATEFESRAFVVTDRVGQRRLDDGELDVTHFIFQPGEVFARFLLGPGYQTARLSAQALKYNPYKEAWEKRLTRYLSWQWRTTGPGDHWHRYRVEQLLKEVGREADPRRPSETKERLEKCLERLEQDQVLARWQYAGWDEAQTGTRGWLAAWLRTTILIEPPAPIVAQQYEPQVALPALTPPAGDALPPADTDLGALIRAHRKRLGLNQAQTAAALGVHQSYISKLERGHKSVANASAAFLNALRAWLVSGPDGHPADT